MKLHWVVMLALLIVTACSGQHDAKKQEPPPTVSEASRVLGRSVNTLDARVSVIFQDQRGVYWFAGGKQGVVAYDGTSWLLYTEQDGLASYEVAAIQEDGSGNLYFDTLVGVSRFDGKTFTTLDIVESSSSSENWRLEPGDLWFSMGWDKRGPYRFDGEVLHYLPFPKNAREDLFYAENPNPSYNPYGIYRIYQDSKGTVWFGTASFGVGRFDSESLRWLYEKHLTTTPGGGDFGIRSIVEDNEGTFWFCNLRNRYEILADQPGGEDRNQLHYQKSPGIAFVDHDGKETFPYFISITKDDRGDLWMMTYNDGVFRKKGEALIHYPIQHGDENALLFSIYKDRGGQIWVGTHNAGVYRFNGQTFEPFAP